MRLLLRGGMTLALLAAALLPAGASAEGDPGTHSPVKHTIILYQENISFDHYFGTYPGANGIPDHPAYFHTSTTGAKYGPYSPQLLTVAQATTCDVDHKYTDMIRMVDHGNMDMFLNYGNDKTVGTPSSTCPSFESNPNGQALALSYYDGSTLKNYWSLAENYALADNFFQGVYGPSTPGAEWLVAATNNTVGDPNPVGDKCNDYFNSLINPQDIPNLGQEASAKGLSWAWFQGGFGTCTGATSTHGYSAHHDPFQYFTSTADLNHTYAYDPKLDYSDPSKHQRDLDVLYAALARTSVGGSVPQLPSISWVKAPAADDGHPGYSNPVNDDGFVADLVARLKASPYWNDTALFVAFDETGGWWDHVAPPDLGGPFATWVIGQPNLSGCQYEQPGQPPCGEAGLGPRMPVLVISSLAKHGFVDHDLLNTASLDKWVEWDYHLPALGVWGDRDRTAGSFLNAFSFGPGAGGGA